MPEGLAIAQVSPAQVTAVLSRVNAATPLVQAMAAAQSALDQGSAALTMARTLANDHAPDGAAAVSAAEAQLAAAGLAWTSARAALFSEATADLPQPAAAMVGVYASGLHTHVPAELRAVAREPAQWTAIQAALRAEARAARLQTELAEAHAALLASVRADPAVQAAAVSLASSLPALKAALEAPQLPAQP